MSFEFLLPSFSDLGNISLVVLVVVAALFYFGKLISSVKTTQYQKEDYYIEGFFFAFFYIGIPYILLIVATELFSLNLSFILATNIASVLIILLVEGIITYFLATTLLANYARFTLFSQTKEAYKKAYNKQKIEKPIIASIEKTTSKYDINLAERSLGLQTSIADTICKPISVIIISSILVLIFYSTYNSFNNSGSSFSSISLVIFVLTFVNYTLLAFAFGYINHYNPPATVYLEDGTTISGKLVRRSKMIYLVDDNEHKIILINSEKVTKMEMDMFKENGTNKF